MTGNRSLAVVIPAYNAADTLSGVLSQVFAFAMPVLVVNDGSTDATRETAAGFRSNESWITNETVERELPSRLDFERQAMPGTLMC